MSNKIQSKASKESVSTNYQQINSNDLVVAGTKQKAASKPSKELGGPKGLEPTRYGDWEAKGRCYDF